MRASSSFSSSPTIASLEWDKTMQWYLSEGLAEVVCDLFDHFQLSERLLQACLVVLSKLIQEGNTLCNQRLVALGLVDKVS